MARKNTFHEVKKEKAESASGAGGGAAVQQRLSPDEPAEARENEDRAGDLRKKSYRKGGLAFSNLTPSQTISYGTSWILVSGKLEAATGEIRVGIATATIAGTGVTAASEIGHDGCFSVKLHTHRIDASAKPYPIKLSFAGERRSERATDSSTTLTVEKASPAFTEIRAYPSAVTYGRGSITVSGVLGGPDVFPTGQQVTVQVQNTPLKDEQCLVDSSGRFSANLQTDGVPALDYQILCTYTGDSKNFSPAPDGSTRLGINQADAVFTALNSPSIVYGAGPTPISGNIRSSTGAAIPSGAVRISLGTTVTELAPIDGTSGDFQADIDTQQLPAGIMPFVVHYPGDPNFTSPPDGKSNLTVTPATPVFQNLVSPSISYGGGPTVLSGNIASLSGPQIPSGSVRISLGGMVVQAPIDQQTGKFAASFDTRTLPVSGSPFPVTYDYPGDMNFTHCTNSATSVTFRMVPITGKVMLAGAGISGLPVVAMDTARNVQVGHDKTNNGSYTLNVPAGLSVEVEFPPNHILPDSRKIFLRGPHRNYVQPFQATALDAGYDLRDALISGTVVKQIAGTSATEPLSGVGVTLVDAATQVVVERQTSDAQGCFGFSKSGQFTLQFDTHVRDGNDLLSTNTPAVGVVAQAGYALPPVKMIYQALGAQVVGQVTDGINGLEGVSVELFSAAAKQTIAGVTGALGFYSFPNVPAGDVALIFKTLAQDKAGNKWELQPGQAASQTFKVASSSIRTAVPTLYEPERHTITWTVTIQGKPVPGKLVEVRTKDGISVLAAKRTNEKGIAFFELDQANDYTVWVYPDDRVPGGVLTHTVTVNSNYSQGTEIPYSPGGFEQPRDGEVRESVIDLQSYPILTEEVPAGIIPGQGGYGSSSGASAPIGQVAQNAINEVLSWRSKPSDPKAFASALAQAFTLKEFEGHTEWSWTPRSYTVQTDMGAVTGAQASIYNRATVALNQSLPMLDGLYPLLPTIPQEDLNSIREVARAEYTALVNEFGVVGGPRAPRVDQLFTLLLGDLAVTDPETLAAGTLYILRNRFGLRRQYVTTIEDEQNLTNFLILADYIIGLNQSWKNEKAYFVRNGCGGVEPYFGTQLVLLSRALDVVSQSVRDAYFAMDSVFLGAAERQTTQLDFSGVTLPRALVNETSPYQFPPGTSSLFVSELLDWVDRAASEELPQMLKTAGKDGLPGLKSVIDNLRHFVRAALLPTQKATNLPPGYRTPRAQRTMQELADALDETYRLSYHIHEPRLPVFGLKAQGQIA